MVDDFSTTQIWLLLASVAAISFYAGRVSASTSSEAQERYRHMAQEAAAQDFARLSATAQAEVDRLIAEGKTLEGIKLIRAALDTGLYEAKQIVDQRKRSASSRDI